MADKTLYRVHNWEKHFECAPTRKIVGSLKWLPLPVRHDGASFRRLMRRDDGVSVFGCWILILQVAAKCRVRGVLSGDHGAIDSDEMELITDVPAAVFSNAFTVLSSTEIGWLEVVQPQSRRHPPPSAAVSADSGEANPASAAMAVYIQTDIHTDKEREKPKTDAIASIDGSGRTLAQVMANIASQRPEHGVDVADHAAKATGGAT